MGQHRKVRKKRNYNFVPRPCAAYDGDGNIIAVADSIHELADILGVHPTTVSHGLHRGSKKYGWIEDDD